MIIESLDEYLETLAGYIYDNDKLVTYKWLSKELEVHVNVAKQILWEFRQRHRKEAELTTTILLMGVLHDGGMRVEVVKELDLPKAKERYSKIISEHIYSLQKALPDIELLAISGEGDVKYSAIKCKDSVERSEEEMHILRWGTTISKEVPTKAQENAKSTSDSMETELLQAQTKPEVKSIAPKKGGAGQKKGFNNLFGKVTNKQKSPPSTTSDLGKGKSPPTKASNGTKAVSPKKSPSPKKKQQKGGLDCFLEKNQEKPASTTSPEDKKVANTVTKESKNQNVSVPNKAKKQQKDVRGKKRNRSKEDSSTAKKRKRIAVQSDSSDSGSSHEEEVEPELPPSPPPAPPPKARSPSPPKVKHEGGKRKVLKLVDKTFEEDGYLVTKKVHVYESCSEEEEPEKEEAKKSVAPETRSEPKGKKSTKQTTLMNFFKKS